MSIITRFLDPTNDFAFKQVFGTEKHKDILIHFLNDVLKLEGKHRVEDVEFLKTIQDPEIAIKKQSIVDVLCREKSGRQFIIEMQVARTSGFKERALYYASKAYINQMGKGGKYEHLKEVIFIAIIDYELFPDKKNYHSSHALCDQDTHEQDLKGMRFEFLELPRFHKTLDNISTMIEKWCYFFKYAPDTTPDELMKLVGEDAVIKEAYEALDRAYWTDNELLTYEQEMKRENDALAILRYAAQEGERKGLERGLQKGLEQGLQQGIEKGIERGIEEGIEKGREQGLEKGREEGRTSEKIIIARNALRAGLDLSIIIQLTGLSIVEIEEL